MANQDNQCSGLEIEDLYQKQFVLSENDNNGCALHRLFSLQKDIQENVYGYNFAEMRKLPLFHLSHFFLWNTHAQADEAHEAMDALGGIKDGIGSAVWKPWKKDNAKIKAINETPMTFNDLSDNDVKELKMELIDELHFLFNKMHAVGMTTDELYNFYFSKNKENRERQEKGY